jgi:hypothetical protein
MKTIVSDPTLDPDLADTDALGRNHSHVQDGWARNRSVTAPLRVLKTTSVSAPPPPTEKICTVKRAAVKPSKSEHMLVWADHHSDLAAVSVTHPGAKRKP